MAKYLYLFIFIIIVFASSGQQKLSIKGQVLDRKDLKAFPFVNVFLEGTTIGTQTNQDGTFIIKNIPIGNYRLVASMIGYKSAIQNIEILDKNLEVQISIEEESKVLNEVKVIGKRDKVWEKQFKEFESEFLGNDLTKKEVKILNKKVIDFIEIKEKGEFSAQSKQPIVIENLNLGYKQTYHLDVFEKKHNRISYKGLIRYESIDAKNNKQKKRWEENRKDAYLGSIRHFFKSLLNNRLKEEGFKAYYLNTDFTKSPNSPLNFEYKPKEIIKPTTVPNLYSLTIPKPLVILYENEQLSAQISEIKPLSEIIISSEGNLLDPYSLEITGKMGEKRMANLLPLDFELNNENKITFHAPYNKVILDTISAIPPISNSKSPINWNLVDNSKKLNDLEERKSKISFEKIKNEMDNILLKEVVVIAKKGDPNAINGISPNIVIDEKRIINQSAISNLLNTLLAPRRFRYGTGLKVYIDNQELSQEEINNIDFDVSPSVVEKILIFDEIIPINYGRATCAIVIKLR